MEKPSLKVFKIGGNIINNSDKLDLFLTHLSHLNQPFVLIHGGGRMASDLQVRLGQQPQMVNGRRVTDAATLDVVTMVYAGLINKNITAQLASKGIMAVGLSGADAAVMQATQRPPFEGVDYGLVGDITKVNVGFLNDLIKGNYCPVLCSIACNTTTGQLLNTNADTIAAEIASALCSVYSVELFLCFEKPGVLLNANKPDSLIELLTFAHFDALREKHIIFEGMIPKLHNGFEVLRRGAQAVYITDYLVAQRLANNTAVGGTLLQL